MENTNPTNPLVPESIIYFILLCLPVKSLLRFKSVCKSWLSLISAPDFVKNHLFASTYDPYLTYHHLILAEQPLGSQLFPQIVNPSTCSLYSLLRENLTESMCFEPVIDSIEDEINRIVGYCNGLICLVEVEKNHVVLWNPSTRKSRRLPKLDMIREDDGPCYGFCFDELDDDFKVFALFGCSKYKVSVYSWKSDSWRLIGDIAFGRRVYEDGKFGNGAIYWVFIEGLSNKIVVSFDIKTETYREIRLPKQIYEEETRPRWILDTFCSRPYILHILGTRVDFWMMDEHDPEEPWTKWFTIPCDRPPATVRYLNRKPICIFENGDVMLNLYEDIVIYNYQDKTFETLLDFDIEGLEVYRYVESLVSP